MSAFGAVVLNGEVNAALWDARVREGNPVGACPNDRCVGLLYGQPVRRWGRIRWYEATCRICGHEVNSPNGRLAPKQTCDA